MHNLLSKLCLLIISSSILVSSTRLIGYYSLANGYANQAGCAPVLTPDRIPAELYTHIILAFTGIGNDHTVLDPTNETLASIPAVQAMKERNPNLKTMISIGGWSMNMSLYSTSVSTAAGRTALVQSTMAYLRKWNWDGADFDWEYPSDPTRGGTAQDPQNFVLFLQEMRQAVEAENIPSGKSKLILSIPLPGGSWHGQYYLMDQIISNLDFANIMAYNLHGPWEPEVYCSANFYDGTPATYEFHGYSINDAIQYFLHQNNNTLPAEKFNLGVTFAGVAFTLTDPTNNQPGAPASGEGNGGVCTKEAGYMAYFEVETLMADGIVKSTSFDSVGYCKYFTYNTSQWIGYDDAETLAQKVALVEKIGLGGVSVWAMYAESGSGPVLQTAIANALFPSGKPTASDYAGDNSGSNMLSFSYAIIIFIIMTLFS